MVVLHYYGGAFYIEINNSHQKIDICDLTWVFKKNKLVFFNLMEHALIILDFLIKTHFNINRVVVFNLIVYSIYTEYGVIKCYKSFGFYQDPLPSKPTSKYLNELNEFSLKHIGLTLFDFKINSSASIVTTFLKKNNKYCIFLKLNSDQEAFIRSAYFGGRCELFLPGVHNNLIYYDFKSMYGNIMLEKFPQIVGHPTKYNNDYPAPGFYEVTVNQTASMKLPTLPVKVPSGTYYPYGIFNGIYWYEEIAYFLEAGGEVLKFHKFLKVESLENIFKEKIQYLLEARLQNNMCAKTLINSFYGRLAINNINTTTNLILEGDEAPLISNPSVLKYLKYGNIYLVENISKINKKLESNLVAATIITARARIKLNKSLIKDINQSSKIVYVDTDGVFLKKKDNTIENDSSKNIVFYSTGVFFTEKNYNCCLDGAWKYCGSPKNYFKSFKRQNINNITQPHEYVRLLPTLMNEDN